MNDQEMDMIREAYANFNAREADKVLANMHPDVQWANGWEGGYVQGRNDVKNYWIRQWKEIDPVVKPTGFLERPDGTLEVSVHQHVKDLQGELLFDGPVKHIYTLEDGRIKMMRIEKA